MTSASTDRRVLVQSLPAGIVQAPQVCLEASDEFS